MQGGKHFGARVETPVLIGLLKVPPYHVQRMANNRRQMLVARTNDTPRMQTARAAISNGTRLLEGVDGRSASARRYRDLVESFTADLGGFGLTNADMALVRQAAATTMRAEQLQAEIVRGDAVDSDMLVRLSNASARILAALRAKRPGKPTGPTLQEYLAQRAAAPPVAQPAQEAPSAAETRQEPPHDDGEASDID
jgi:hypothetical protein